jgi:hypothetical protein
MGRGGFLLVCVVACVGSTRLRLGLLGALSPLCPVQRSFSPSAPTGRRGNAQSIEIQAQVALRSERDQQRLAATQGLGKSRPLPAAAAAASPVGGPRPQPTAQASQASVLPCAIAPSASRFSSSGAQIPTRGGTAPRGVDFPGALGPAHPPEHMKRHRCLAPLGCNDRKTLRGRAPLAGLSLPIPLVRPAEPPRGSVFSRPPSASASSSSSGSPSSSSAAPHTQTPSGFPVPLRSPLAPSPPTVSPATPSWPGQAQSQS